MESVIHICNNLGTKRCWTEHLNNSTFLNNNSSIIYLPTENQLHSHTVTRLSEHEQLINSTVIPLHCLHYTMVNKLIKLTRETSVCFSHTWHYRGMGNRHRIQQSSTCYIAEKKHVNNVMIIFSYFYPRWIPPNSYPKCPFHFLTELHYPLSYPRWTLLLLPGN